MADSTERATSGLAVLLTRQGLVEATYPIRSEVLHDEAWAQLVASVQRYRIAGALASAIHSGALPSTTAQREHAHRMHAATIGSCLRLERMLGEVLDLFDARGIAHRVLKGPSFAALDYPDPALRIFGDIDLLVPAEQFDTAADALARDGFRRHFPEVRPGFDRRYGKGASFTGPTGLQVDLHRTFVMGAFGLAIPLDELWAESEPFEVAGRGALALSPRHRALHACFHAVLGRREPQLVPLRDLAGMLDRGRIEPDQLLATARRWKASPVVAAAVREVDARFGTMSVVLTDFATTFAPSGREAMALRSYSDPALGFAARQYAGLAYIPGLVDKVRYAAALLSPGRSYGSGRHGGRLSRLRSAAQEIARVHRRVRR